MEIQYQGTTITGTPTEVYALLQELGRVRNKPLELVRENKKTTILMKKVRNKKRIFAPEEHDYLMNARGKIPAKDIGLKLGMPTDHVYQYWHRHDTKQHTKKAAL